MYITTLSYSHIKYIVYLHRKEITAKSAHSSLVPSPHTRRSGLGTRLNEFSSGFIWSYLVTGYVVVKALISMVQFKYKSECVPVNYKIPVALYIYKPSHPVF